MNRRPSSASGRIFPGLTFLLFLLVWSVAVQAAVPSGRDSLPEAAAGLYAVEPEPLTVAECGRCHLHQFKTIKDEGGAHRFACTDCHEIFHAYNPRKNNFAALMPVCGSCHSLPHGEKMTECLSCHENPHAPIGSLSLQVLAGKCAECHQQPAEQLQKFPSAHSKQACQDCHSQRHGRIPTCFECHEAHYQDQPLAACFECHPVHKPREIAFKADDAAATCSACHKEVFLKWSQTPSRHGKVNCTACHTRHGSLPACTDCHTAPHPPQMLARFDSCLVCHVDPHDPPVK